MGCGSCGTGKPNGCKSNGGCSTGGCNRLNVHDWLMNLPVADVDTSCRIVEVSFNQGSRKDFYRNATLQFFEKGDLITLEGTGGFDVGEVSLTGELVRLQLKRKGVKEFDPEIKKILRPASQRDIEIWQNTKAREKEMLIKSRVIARSLKLDMKLSEIEIQADGKKATFFYTADDRVDFRELIKQYNAEFKVRVEMRQIGIRQEAAKVGGIGSCGRELCCSTWHQDFKSVTTTAARYQNLAINQTKLSGQCGRLKCCLNYELDTYLDALQHFPDNADQLQTVRGTAYLIKKDIFKNLMWYTLPESTKHYPLTIKRVIEILQENKRGQRVQELQAVEIEVKKEHVSNTGSGFEDVVGQISLRSLEKSSKKRRDKEREKTNTNRSNSNRPPSRNMDRPQQHARQQEQKNQNPQQTGSQPDKFNTQQRRPDQRNIPNGSKPNGNNNYNKRPPDQQQ